MSEREHIVDGKPCWCGPSYERVGDEGGVWLHRQLPGCPDCSMLRARLALAEKVVKAFSMIEDNCPRWLDPATVTPGKTVDEMPPHQAVLQFSIGYTKWEALKAAVELFSAGKAGEK